MHISSASSVCRLETRRYGGLESLRYTARSLHPVRALQARGAGRSREADRLVCKFAHKSKTARSRGCTRWRVGAKANFREKFPGSSAASSAGAERSRAVVCWGPSQTHISSASSVCRLETRRYGRLESLRYAARPLGRCESATVAADVRGELARLVAVSSRARARPPR